MTYEFDDFVDYAARRLNLPLDEKRDIIGAMVIEALRLMPYERFLMPKKANILVSDGYAELPGDLYDVQTNHPVFANFQPGQSSIAVPDAWHTLSFSYRAMPIGKDNLPLIPEAFDKAIVGYIDAEYVFRSRWRTGSASRNDYEYAMRDYKNEIGIARGKVNQITPAQLEEYIRVKSTPRLAL